MLIISDFKITDSIAADIKTAGRRTPALLGGKNVMEADFLKREVDREVGLLAFVIDEAGRNHFGSLMYEQAAGIVKSETRAYSRGCWKD
jgi:aspartate/glutamate racemase